MRVLRSWLEEYGAINLTDDELVLRLVETGTDVEAVTKLIDDKIIAAEIIEIKKHPNADRLRLVVLFDGQSKLEVVCGAQNIKVGHKVPLAQIGARIRGQIIEQTEIRGVISNGMICSELELGLGNDHEGIKILSDDIAIGEKLNQYFSSESLFDLDITPNRGDCMSHLGVAREIAALQKTTIRREPIRLPMDLKPTASQISVEIQAKKHCGQYLARIVKGVKIAPSPEWLASRLEKIGLKSINNVVDITNYIMYDLGQPLHAFDANKICDNKIIVRLAEKDERIVTLEGKERILSSENLIIADGKKAIAVAGVIGGGNSEITEDTKDIILEAAAFDQRSIRKTARQLGLVTDASYRFERGIDETGLEYAINKAAYLIKDIAGGAILSGIVRAGQPPKISEVEIRPEKINSLLGLSLPDQEIDVLLRRLGFEIDGKICKVPSFRHDITIWHDLAEEVARIYGYNNIPLRKLPKIKTTDQSNFYLKEALKDQLTNLGFVETINYPFLSEQAVKTTGVASKDLLEISNPVQPENKYLRNNLISGLLETIAKNSAFTPIAIFEVGQVFGLNFENTHLAVAVAGKDQKTIRSFITVAKDKLSEFLGQSLLTKIKEVDNATLKSLKIRKSQAMCFEINLSEIIPKVKNNASFNLKISKQEVDYRPVSRFPSVTRDLAFVVDRSIKPEEIIKSIYNLSVEINRVELFDEFVSDKLGKNKKNVAFHLFLQDMEKTLSDAEADEVIKNIVDVIIKDFSAELRA